jgi:hypothetical protein
MRDERMLELDCEGGVESRFMWVNVERVFTKLTCRVLSSAMGDIAIFLLFNKQSVNHVDKVHFEKS